MDQIIDYIQIWNIQIWILISRITYFEQDLSISDQRAASESIKFRSCTSVDHDIDIFMLDL